MNNYLQKIKQSWKPEKPLYAWGITLILHGLLFALVYAIFVPSYRSLTDIEAVRLIASHLPFDASFEQLPLPFYLLVLLRKAQQIFGLHDAYATFLVLILYASFSGFLIRILRSLNSFKAIALYLLYFFGAGITFLLALNASQVAGLATLSGMILILPYGNRSFSAESILGFGLLLAGALLAVSAFWIALLTAMPFIILHFEPKYWRANQFTAFFLAMSLIFALYLDRINTEYYQNQKWQNFTHEWQIKKAIEGIDFEACKYDEACLTSLEAAGWTLQDLAMYQKGWIADSLVFNPVRAELFLKNDVQILNNFTAHTPETNFRQLLYNDLLLRGQLILMALFAIFVRRDKHFVSKILSFWVSTALLLWLIIYIAPASPLYPYYPYLIFIGIMPLLLLERTYFKDFDLWEYKFRIAAFLLIIAFIWNGAQAMQNYVNKSVEGLQKRKKATKIDQEIAAYTAKEQINFIDTKLQHSYVTPFQKAQLWQQPTRGVVYPIQENAAEGYLDYWWFVPDSTYKAERNLLGFFMQKHYNQSLKYDTLSLPQTGAKLFKAQKK
ncbi:MAG: hypothetical protein JJT94_09995 [Bernardetiaceae bacterium]|nr:hypothetical protein [Bernardetiaceae bacterium]